MLDQFYVNLPFFTAPQPTPVASTGASAVRGASPSGEDGEASAGIWRWETPRSSPGGKPSKRLLSARRWLLLQKGAKRDYLARLPKKQLLENIKKILISTYLLLLTLLNASCSSNPDEELSKELKTVSSWAATAHMVGEASIKGTVPTVYAKETLKKSREKLQEQTDKLSKSPAAQEKKVLEQLQQIQKTISQMSKAVEQKDNKEIAIQLQHLSKQEKTIRTLAKQLGEQ